MPVMLGGITMSKMEALTELGKRFECKHENAAIRQRKVAGGSVQYCFQCLRCGDRVGRAIARSEVSSTPPPFDEEALIAWRNKSKAAYADLDAKYSSAFWSDYQRYLQSPEWAGRRSLVLKRADGVCEGCRLAPPTVVHHLTYDHVGRELLFELVALCDVCHQVCHGDKKL